MQFKATRLPKNPIITADMDNRMGSHPNGPSLIRVPDWLPNALGRYYLYFADHGGKYIRLAYADNLQGPWQTYEPGTIQLQDSGFIQHIASPDVHIDHENQRLIMYFHGVNPEEDRPLVEERLKPFSYWFGYAQSSRTATSKDGINFDINPRVEPPYYLRRFDYRGRIFGLAMPGMFFESEDGLNNWKALNLRFRDEMRHNDVLVRGDTLHVFYSCRGDAPEVIYQTTVDLNGDPASWKEYPPTVLLKPETEWEGATEPLIPSRGGGARQRVNQLRDPNVFEDTDGRLYLLYAGGGESCICIAELHEA